MIPLDDPSAMLARFGGVDLDELERVASLQTRVDRKYLLPAHRSTELLSALHHDVAVLRIDGACTFRYDTIYFDTPSLDSYLGNAHRRRHRFKVRIRTYVDAGIAALEVKLKGRRDETVKVRASHPVEAGAILTPTSAAFVDETLGQRGLSGRLRPVLATSFVRVTLLDRVDGSRTTLDRDVSLGGLDGAAVVLRDHSIIETKSVGAATAADRWLWAHGHRPTSFSKFCVGMALQHAELPANKWNRILRRDLGWRPQLSMGPRNGVLPEDSRTALTWLSGNAQVRGRC
jgi:hypothetical protein